MKVWRVVLALLLVASATAAFGAWWWLHRPLPIVTDPVELSIEPGTSPHEIAESWVRAGVMTEPLALYEWFRWSGQARRIRAGSYEIRATVTQGSTSAVSNTAIRIE